MSKLNWKDPRGQQGLIIESKTEDKKDMNPKYKEMLLVTTVFVGAFALTYIAISLLF